VDLDEGGCAGSTTGAEPGKTNRVGTVSFALSTKCLAAEPAARPAGARPASHRSLGELWTRAPSFTATISFWVGVGGWTITRPRRPPHVRTRDSDQPESQICGSAALQLCRA